MKIKDVLQALEAITAHGLVSIPVVARVKGAYYFVADASLSVPLVDSSRTMGALKVLGRPNATKHFCLELNAANYPSAKAARDGALNMGILMRACETVPVEREVMASVAHLGKGNSYAHVQRVYFGRIPASGKPHAVSRGGTPAAIIDCD